MDEATHHKGKTVLVAVNDIFFYVKLRDALRAGGYTIERARTQDEVPAKAQALRPAALVLNMNDPAVDGLQALAQLKAQASPHALPILAFANHEEVETWQRAKELGVTKIVSRNEFSARTKDLVDEVITGEKTKHDTIPTA
ncbi:MAG: response regulator [Nitrospirota bacterium]|nr:response regulator [Nitrospirota bacterium]MDE3119652.1 response regulator [Nitrospirota bacterium]MDE3225212.1 response regulator [Nitrospirota bacterium]MDE3244270.1 response regulator [Nitrospirota bacterium]